MYYPFLLHSPEVTLQPVFTGLSGAPYVADLSPHSPLLAGIDVRDQKRFQEILEAEMGPNHQWGFAAYLERRDTLLGDCPQMVTEQRFIHLGVDIIVPLGTPLHSPLDAQVFMSGYEEGEGNYGGFVILAYSGAQVETFYSLFGHLKKDTLPEEGTRFKAGEIFSEIGDFHENGNWFHHTHIQVITKLGIERGYASKGYCSEKDLAVMNELCPSPMPLFRVSFEK